MLEEYAYWLVGEQLSCGESGPKMYGMLSGVSFNFSRGSYFFAVAVHSFCRSFVGTDVGLVLVEFNRK
jgi:hypothetical protein